MAGNQGGYFELTNQSRWQTTAYPLAFPTAALTTYLALNSPQNEIYIASSVSNRWNAYLRAYGPNSTLETITVNFLAVGQ